MHDDPPPPPPQSGSLNSKYLPIDGLVLCSLVLGYLVGITRYRLWRSGSLLNVYLLVVSSPVYGLFGQYVLITSRDPEALGFDIVASVTLLALYASYLYTTTYASTRVNRVWQQLVQEFSHFVVCANVLWAIYYYQSDVDDGYAIIDVGLLALWLLSIIKSISMIVSVMDAEKNYGASSTNIVAVWMQNESMINSNVDASNDVANPESMEGYDYIVLGEEGVITVGSHYKYSTAQRPERMVTVDEIWDRCSSTGDMLVHGSGAKELLKELSLSFALFKLLKRWFDGYPAAEAGQRRSRLFVRRQLLAGDDGGERTFRLIGMQLGFLLDFFYSNHSITYGTGLSFVLLISFFLVLVVFSFLGFLLWSINTTTDTDVKGDFRFAVESITIVQLSLVIIMELSHLLGYLFSDWFRVFLLARITKPKKMFPQPIYRFLLRIVSFRVLSISLCHSINQYSFFHNLEDSSYRRLVYASSFHTIDMRGKKEGRSVKFDSAVKKAISDALKLLLDDSSSDESPPVLPSNGSATLLRHNQCQLLWACSLEQANYYPCAPFTTILVWHIATTFCTLAHEHRNNQPAFTDKSRSSHHVATVLSKYCAYLAVQKPELISIKALLSHQKFFETVLKEAREFFQHGSDDSSVYQAMHQVNSVSDHLREPIIEEGARLGNELMDTIPDQTTRWKVLEELWVELLLFLAPSDNPVPHERALLQGGELITAVWVILYHAGIHKRAS